MLFYSYLEFNTDGFNSNNGKTSTNDVTGFTYGRSSTAAAFDLDLSNSKKRISNEIERLTKSASLNLAVGSGITGAVVFFLGYEVLTQTVKFDDKLSLLSHYIPRLSLIIFAEIFAFFFLKVYRSNLNDIKYFHNELNNNELKFIGARIAMDSKKEEFLKLAIEKFLTTERNFVLKKDETTIELQKDKIEAENHKSIVDALKGVIKIGK